MPLPSLHLRLWATAAGLLFASALLAAAPLSIHPSPDVFGVKDVAHTTPDHSAAQRGTIRFFEKIALKAAVKRLRKSVGKQVWEKMAAAHGDSTAPCDRIVLLDGRTVEAELTDVTPTEIKYRPCGQPDYPKFVLSKKEVLLVMDSDGGEHYRSKKKAPTPNAADTPIHQSAVASAAFSVGAVIAAMLFQSFGISALLALIALIFGLIALSRIRDQPDGRSRKWANLGLIISGLIMLITFLASANSEF